MRSHSWRHASPRRSRVACSKLSSPSVEMWLTLVSAVLAGLLGPAPKSLQMGSFVQRSLRSENPDRTRQTFLAAGFSLLAEIH